MDEFISTIVLQAAGGLGGSIISLFIVAMSLIFTRSPNTLIAIFFICQALTLALFYFTSLVSFTNKFDRQAQYLAIFSILVGAPPCGVGNPIILCASGCKANRGAIPAPARL